MTVGELRKALEGVPDDTPVAIDYDCYLFEVDEGEARVASVKRSDEQALGFGIYSNDGTPYFVIG